VSTPSVSGTESEPTAEAQYETALALVNSPAYRKAAARDKQEMLWTCVSRFPYRALPRPHTSNVANMRRLASRKLLRTPFIADDDVRSPRTKTFHSFGTVAKVRFAAEVEHPFTGIFASGAAGLMRASLATGMPTYSPAASFKFLIDGPLPSQNLVLLASTDTQASRDFFERAPTNRTVEAVIFPNTMMVALLKRWLGPISHPINMQRLEHLAEIASDGSTVANPVAPEVVFLYAPDDVHNDPASGEDFRTILGRIQPGTLLYRVYATSPPSQPRIHIGSIITESPFVASEFGDRILAFKHAWGSPDEPA
jgi:hypothetical protein